MTKQYLVFDSGCSTCTHIAHAIKEVVQDKLEVISHNDPQGAAATRELL